MASDVDVDVLIAKHHDLQERLINKQLPYTYVQLTPGDGNCWFSSICQAFNFYNVAALPSEVVRALHDPLILRNRILDFIQHFSEMNETFSINKAAQISVCRSDLGYSGTDNEIWQNFLEAMRDPFEWATNLIITLSPWFTSVPIKIVSLDSNSSFEYILPNKENSVVDPIIVGCFSQAHFQSLKAVDFVDRITCLSCRNDFRNLKSHLSKTNFCSQFYKDQRFLNFYIRLATSQQTHTHTHYKHTTHK